MIDSGTDNKTAKKRGKKAATAERGESVGVMEPLLVGESSCHRTALTDLAIELAARAAAPPAQRACAKSTAGLLNFSLKNCCGPKSRIRARG